MEMECPGVTAASSEMPSNVCLLRAIVITFTLRTYQGVRLETSVSAGVRFTCVLFPVMGADLSDW